MATSKAYRPNVDYTVGTQVEVATSPVNSKTAFIPSFQAVNAAGAAGAGTGTLTSVDSTASSTTILAANPDRLGATIYNTDANALYILLGAGTASASNLSWSIAANSQYQVPFGYTGIIVGVWAADGAGAAKVTEFTP